MGKINKIFFPLVPAFYLLVSRAMACGADSSDYPLRVTFNKLSSVYTVAYGNPQAPVHIVEYVSLSCPKCVLFIQKAFPLIQEEYINTGKVHWTFHPDPADLVTLQAMICFEVLTPLEKQQMLLLLSHIPPMHMNKKACDIMQKAMDALGKPLPDLHNLHFLQNTPAFISAYEYLSQKNAPVDLPTIEINRLIYRELPSLDWIRHMCSSLTEKIGA